MGNITQFLPKEFSCGILWKKGDITRFQSLPIMYSASGASASLNIQCDQHHG